MWSGVIFSSYPSPTRMCCFNKNFYCNFVLVLMLEHLLALSTHSCMTQNFLKMILFPFFVLLIPFGLCFCISVSISLYICPSDLLPLFKLQKPIRGKIADRLSRLSRFSVRTWQISSTLASLCMSSLSLSSAAVQIALWLLCVKKETSPLSLFIPQGALSLAYHPYPLK